MNDQALEKAKIEIEKLIRRQPFCGHFRYGGMAHDGSRCPDCGMVMRDFGD